MSPNNMREFIEKIKFLDEADESEYDALISLEEARGFIQGMKHGWTKAETKQELKKEKKNIEDGWVRFSTAKNIDDDDVEGFQKFLEWWNFDAREINEIIGDELTFDLDDALDRAASVQWESGRGVTGKKRGGPFKKPASLGGDLGSVLSYYQKSLGGNTLQLQAELSAISRRSQLGGDPLATLAYDFLKKGGKGKE